MNPDYRIITSKDGSTVQLFTTNRGWVDVVAFVRDDHTAMARQWVNHQTYLEYLDQLDNA